MSNSTTTPINFPTMEAWLNYVMNQKKHSSNPQNKENK